MVMTLFWLTVQSFTLSAPYSSQNFHDQKLDSFEKWD